MWEPRELQYRSQYTQREAYKFRQAWSHNTDSKLLKVIELSTKGFNSVETIAHDRCNCRYSFFLNLIIFLFLYVHHHTDKNADVLVFLSIEMETKMFIVE